MMQEKQVVWKICNGHSSEWQQNHSLQTSCVLMPSTCNDKWLHCTLSMKKTAVGVKSRWFDLTSDDRGWNSLLLPKDLLNTSKYHCRQTGYDEAIHFVWVEITKGVSWLAWRILRTSSWLRKVKTLIFAYDQRGPVVSVVIDTSDCLKWSLEAWRYCKLMTEEADLQVSYSVDQGTVIWPILGLYRPVLGQSWFQYEQTRHNVEGYCGSGSGWLVNLGLSL